MKLKRRENIFRTQKKSHFKTITFFIVVMMVLVSYVYSVDPTVVDML